MILFFKIKTRNLQLFLCCVCGYKYMEKSLEDTQQTVNNDTVSAVRVKLGKTFMFLISIYVGYSILF